jgi:ABC-type nitrate/sulfonate/bicarbonate transport system substrate-binding protein
MTSTSHTLFSRRRLMGTAAAAVSTLGLGKAARAQALRPLSFQLSWVKSMQYGGQFAALDQGFYKREGIEPNFMSGGANIDAVANVAAGRAQMGDRPIGPIVLGREKGMPLKVIATVFQTSPFAIMTLASKPVKTVQELAGKTVAVSTSGQPLLANLIRDSGIDPASVNIVPSSPDPAALVAGTIDAYCGYATNQGVMLTTRGIDIYSLYVHDLGLPETSGTIYATEAFLAANRDLVVKFLRATVAGWTWALDHPAETAKMMVDTYGAPGLDYTAQFTEIKASKPFIDGEVASKIGLLSIDLPLYDKIIALYRKVGMVKSDMTAKDLCDPSFIAEAHKATT